jgi:hypothetical protein
MRALAIIVACGASLGLFAPAVQAATPVVHVYDVQVTGVFRVVYSLPSKPLPLDFGYSERSSWTENYPGVRVEIEISEFAPEQVELRMDGKGTIKGKTTYSVSGPRIKGCGWKSTRSEQGSLTLFGNPRTPAAPGGVAYRLDLRTGRNIGAVPQHPADCTYYEANWAKFAGVPVGPSGAVGSGTVDTRSVALVVELDKSQRPGAFGFPLNRLYAGAGFVITVKAKSKDQSGRKPSEGTARITCTPRRP